jgi:hypothetical protein
MIASSWTLVANDSRPPIDSSVLGNWVVEFDDSMILAGGAGEDDMVDGAQHRKPGSSGLSSLRIVACAWPKVSLMQDSGAIISPVEAGTQEFDLKAQ